MIQTKKPEDGHASDNSRNAQPDAAGEWAGRSLLCSTRSDTHPVRLKEFHLSPPATPEAVHALSQVLPPNTPRDFFEFLRRTDGAEAALDPDWEANEPDCIRIDSVESLTQLHSTFAERYPQLLVIGGDAATKLIAYDMTRPSPWPIVIFDSFTDEFASTIQLLASDFASLQRKFFSNESKIA